MLVLAFGAMTAAERGVLIAAAVLVVFYVVLFWLASRAKTIPARPRPRVEIPAHFDCRCTLHPDIVDAVPTPAVERDRGAA